MVVTTLTQGLVDYWWGLLKFWFHPYTLIIAVMVIVDCSLLIWFFHATLSRVTSVKRKAALLAEILAIV